MECCQGIGRLAPIWSGHINQVHYAHIGHCSDFFKTNILVESTTTSESELQHGIRHALGQVVPSGSKHMVFELYDGERFILPG